MESNPGKFGVTATRNTPDPEDDIIELSLTLGDARRLHHLLNIFKMSNESNSIWGLRNRLMCVLKNVHVNGEDLG